MAQLRHGVRAVRAATRRRDHHLRRRIRRYRSSSAGRFSGCWSWLRFDRLSLRTGASEMLRMADMPTAEVLIAKIVFWIVWIGFIVSAVDTLQFAPFQGLVDEFFRFVPRFLVALLVLRSASWSATFCGGPRCWHRSMPGCPVRAC